MVHDEVERQEPPAHDLNGSLPAVADVGESQIAVDGLAEDPVDSPGVYGSGIDHRTAGYAGFEKCLNKTLCCTSGQSQESTGLVSGEQTRVQADQGDPFGLLPGETKRPQQFFSSLQVSNHRLPGVGHGVCMSAC